MVKVWPDLQKWGSGLSRECCVFFGLGGGSVTNP